MTEVVLAFVGINVWWIAMVCTLYPATPIYASVRDNATSFGAFLIGHAVGLLVWYAALTGTVLVVGYGLLNLVVG